MSRLLRTYWREFLLLLLISIPVATLLIAGTLSIIQSDLFFPIFGLMALAGVIATWLRKSIRQNAAQHQSFAPNADGAWTPEEKEAWKKVQEIATAAQKEPPQDAAALKALATDVISVVAGSLHTDAKFAWAKFTLPELLMAVEQASKHLRASLLTRVPGSQTVTASNVMWTYHFYTAHKTKALLLHWGFRAYRAVTTPWTAAVQEVKDHFVGKATAGGRDVAHGWASRLITEELGRAAINLYSGRMRRSDDQAIVALQNAAPTIGGPVPVRILVAGQTNSGKSSLVNSLRGSVQARVSELPTRGGMKEFRFTDGGKLDLTIIDTPGLPSIAKVDKNLITTCQDVDLIIWTAQANQPARQVDLVALQAIRNWFKNNPHVVEPTIVMAITHIDRLKPFREWEPPYDIANPKREKARQIQEAVMSIGNSLSMQEEALVPVSLMDGEPPYNLDALWAVIAKQMNGASQVALGRALKQSVSFRLSEVLTQCYEGGKFIFNRL